jgi:hypothetical protein
MLTYSLKYKIYRNSLNMFFIIFLKKYKIRVKKVKKIKINFLFSILKDKNE